MPHRFYCPWMRKKAAGLVGFSNRLLALSVGPNGCQLLKPGPVLVKTWYGGMPPVQLKSKFVPVGASWALMDGAAPTVTVITALLDNPPVSVTRTWKLFVPAFGDNGVPLSAPLVPTFSQLGPLSFANVIVSPLGSAA